MAPAIWFVLAAHRFYGSGWVLTVLRSLVLGVVDLVLVAVAVLFTTVVALLGS